MIPILERPQLLKEYADASTLLAFDFDGTLAPIVDDPSQARMRAQTREHLALIAQRHPCIVITGRARADALPLLEGLNLAEVIGNHGLETADIDPRRYTARVRGWHQTLMQSLRLEPGVWMENKHYSLAVHYRQAPDPEAAVNAIRVACAPLVGLRRVEGKCVVNLLPAEAAHKGAALLTVRARLATQRMVFIGDDETDEDVFALANADRMLGIRVGYSATSQAAYYLNAQDEMDRLLEHFLR